MQAEEGREQSRAEEAGNRGRQRKQEAETGRGGQGAETGRASRKYAMGLGFGSYVRVEVVAYDRDIITLY